MAILITGGAGYIGSHTCVELLNAGYDLVIIDNFSNSKVESLKRVMAISGKKLTIVTGDMRDRALLESIFKKYACDAVIHFAGLKSVGESTKTPLFYHDNNVNGTIQLLLAMEKYNVKKIVFSSSATVYGEPLYLPIDESHRLSATNPYGSTKLVVENFLMDYFKANPSSSISILRYFNPVGAHVSGLIGEDPLGIPNNLMPYIAQVAAGKRDYLSVWGNDYPTNDGTGIRDYIHVTDLATGHLQALRSLKPSQYSVYNLGTGVGHSVFEVLKAFEAVSGCEIPYKIFPRRNGDVAACYANPIHASISLGWKASKCLTTICRDHWNWQVNNPNGYLGDQVLNSNN